MDFVQADSTAANARLVSLAVEKNVSNDTTAELPDITGMFIVLLVTLGLFVVPVGATLMQGPQIVAGIFGG